MLCGSIWKWGSHIPDKVYKKILKLGFNQYLQFICSYSFWRNKAKNTTIFTLVVWKNNSIFVFDGKMWQLNDQSVLKNNELVDNTDILEFKNLKIYLNHWMM
jgi:hypothetical protein